MFRAVVDSHWEKVHYWEWRGMPHDNNLDEPPDVRPVPVTWLRLVRDYKPTEEAVPARTSDPAWWDNFLKEPT